jgi:nucleoside-diphosphate-sugar epimerase
MEATRTVLVTGGSGFIGGWCIASLLEAGYSVRTTVRDLAREGEVREAVASATDRNERLEVATADLMSDDGWPEAVAGCDYVLHVASPLPATQPKDPDEVIVPAREGTLRVLRASLDAGVKRVVMTSSVAAIRGSARRAEGQPLTEDDWSDPNDSSLTPYARSKTAAEQAAWALMRERDATDRLAAVNPGAVIGPLLSDDPSYSLEAVDRMLGGMPGLPKLGFSWVDVRDVAALHVLAMTAPEAGGERFIAVERFLWMAEVGAVLRRRLGERARKVPTRTVPNFLVRGMALFDGSLRSVVSDLGQNVAYSNEKAKTRLGWSPRPAEESIVDCAESLLAKREAAGQQS